MNYALIVLVPITAGLGGWQLAVGGRAFRDPYAWAGAMASFLGLACAAFPP